jgi:hypothetical protein
LREILRPHLAGLYLAILMALFRREDAGSELVYNHPFGRKLRKGVAFLVCLGNQSFSARENHRGRAGWGMLPIRGSGARP